MSRKDFQEIWRHGTKEKTTSSPHSPHFGHYKAIAKDNKLSGMMAQVLSLPMMVGFSPELYRVMTALMLQKRPGNIRVDTQRWIVLLNSMFSASCRFTARKVAQNATKHKLIAKEQMGSQKQMTAMSTRHSSTSHRSFHPKMTTHLHHSIRSRRNITGEADAIYLALSIDMFVSILLRFVATFFCQRTTIQYWSTPLEILFITFMIVLSCNIICMRAYVGTNTQFHAHIDKNVRSFRR